MRFSFPEALESSNSAAKHTVAFANKKFICCLQGDEAEGNFLDLLERSGRRGVNFLLFSTLLISHDQGVVAGRRISRPRWPTRNIICILKQSVRSDIMQRRGAAGIVSRTHECAPHQHIILFVFLHTRSASLPRDVGIRDRIITSSPREMDTAIIMHECHHSLIFIIMQSILFKFVRAGCCSRHTNSITSGIGQSAVAPNILTLSGAICML